MTKVTVEDGDRKWTYEGDYVAAGVVTLAKEEGKKDIVRPIDAPRNWKDGLGTFHVAVQLLRCVADGDGKGVFKDAAKAALDIIDRIEKGETDESGGQREESGDTIKTEGEVQPTGDQFGEGTLRSARVRERRSEGTEQPGSVG